MKFYALIFLVATAATYLTVPLVRQFAIATGTLAPVRARDVHQFPTPRLGGVAMGLGFLVALFIAGHTPYLNQAVNWDNAKGLVVGTVLICLLGVVDDIWDLDWYTKLAGQILIAGIMAYLGIQLTSFPVFGLTIGSSRLSLIATVLVVVAAINAVNFVDGLDGLASGMMAIGAAGLFIYSYALTKTLGAASYASLATTVAAALVGICLGFLAHNFSPASIFMGDTGAMLLGLLTAAAAIIITGQIDPAAVYFRQAFPSFLPVLLPIAVLAIPLFDMVASVIRRLYHHQSPFQADAGHLHHRLSRAGRSRVRAVLVMYLWTAVFSLGAASLTLLRMRYVLALVSVASVLALVVSIEILPAARERVRRVFNPRYRPVHGPVHAWDGSDCAVWLHEGKAPHEANPNGEPPEDCKHEPR